MLRFKNEGYLTYYPTLQNNDSTSKKQKLKLMLHYGFKYINHISLSTFSMKDLFSLFFLIQ